MAYARVVDEYHAVYDYYLIMSGRNLFNACGSGDLTVVSLVSLATRLTTFCKELPPPDGINHFAINSR